MKPGEPLRLKYVSPGPIADGFLLSESFVAGIRGPIGSGKSTACVMKLLGIAARQPIAPDGRRHSRFAIIRNTYPELKTTTVKTWHQWVPPGQIGQWQNEGPPTHHIVTDELAMEVMFVALDRPEDVRKLLSMELTAAWINEAREVPKAILDGLTGRVGRFPPVRDGGCAGPQILMDTNSPDADHWWYIIAERDESTKRGAELLQSIVEAEAALRTQGALGANQQLFEFFAQPSGLSPDAENIPNLPAGYYQRAMAGKTEEWIKVYVRGEYGFVMDGRPVFPEYRDSLHCKPFELNPRLELVAGFDFGLCYSADTEVLTQAGWKFFKDVDASADLAATLNPETFAVEYAPIAFKIERDYVGELIEFASQNFNFCVTPEHRTPFTHRESPHRICFASAADLETRGTSHRFIQLAGTWTGEPFCWCGLPEEMAAEFLGWYISEGSVYKNGNSYRVSIAQRKSAPNLEALLHRREWGLITWRHDQNGYRATVPWPMGEKLFALGKAWTKHLPQELKNASQRVLRVFLAAYVAGDGHVRSKARMNSGIGRTVRDEITVATVSSALKDDLQEVALKAGYGSATRIQRARMSVMADGRQIACPDIFVLSLKRFQRAEILPHHIRRVPYAGKIYCLNVPYHTLYVRRNGRPSWNGNTPAAGIGQRGIMGQWRWRYEITTEHMGARRFGELFNRFVNEKLPGWKFASMTGDPAGMAESQADENTPFAILKAVGVHAHPAHTNDPTIRREALALPMTRIIDGEPGLLIHPDCKMLRKGLAGGYHHRRVQVLGDERYHDQPDKNLYSHIVEAVEYGMLGAGEGKALVRPKRDRPRARYATM